MGEEMIDILNVSGKINKQKNCTSCNKNNTMHHYLWLQSADWVNKIVVILNDLFCL